LWLHNDWIVTDTGFWRRTCFRKAERFAARLCPQVLLECRKNNTRIGLMQMTISGHHVELTPALKEYVQSKLTRVERHFDHITSMHVILTIEKLAQKAEATIRIAGAELFANAESPDMYAAIDLLSDKLDRQIVRHKEKLKAHH